MSNIAKGLAESTIETQNVGTSPWAPGVWQAAREGFLSGTDPPPPRFPFIIGQDSLFSTAEKLQQLASLPSPPDVETTTVAPWPWEDKDAADDRKVLICDFDWDLNHRIRDTTEGENVSVMFKGTERFAWLARSLKQMPENVNIGENLPWETSSPWAQFSNTEANLEENLNARKSPWTAEAWQAARDDFLAGIERPPPRFGVIICQDSPFSTAEKLQQFARLPVLPNIATTMILPINHDDTGGPPADCEEVQICEVDWNQKSTMKYYTEGELISIWFNGTTRKAWLARSIRQQSPDSQLLG
ncbi:hypothetical protein V495_01226 [Pseudogymnoascus sp. VKM F-4514 (FW-929)]|nr:hypothetical protein V495_01226 [Pseudogymnoascus sp. VKM F-4514 (FW-929)]KFY59561.1 hypothetical protein V497_04191 [Pseudogymnoascus sp. VKM F-4516 (FW-969)]